MDADVAAIELLSISRGNAAKITRELVRALEEAKAAYEYAANSYTYSAMAALMAAIAVWEAATGPIN